MKNTISTENQIIGILKSHKQGAKATDLLPVLYIK